MPSPTDFDTSFYRAVLMPMRNPAIILEKKTVAVVVVAYRPLNKFMGFTHQL